MNEDSLVENQKEESLIVSGIVCDTIKVFGGVKSVSITNNLLKSARNAHSVYIDSKNAKLAANKKELQEKQAKKIKAEAKGLENKKTKILKEAAEKADVLQDEINALKGRRRAT